MTVRSSVIVKTCLETMLFVIYAGYCVHSLCTAPGVCEAEGLPLRPQVRIYSSA